MNEGKNEVKISYKKHSFDRKDAPLYVAGLANDFKDFYSKKGYLEHQSVPITSGIDPTVRFIGSHISVFKPHLFKGTIPNPGYFLQQNCLRTQNVRRLTDEDYCPKWGSYFPSLGLISTPNRLQEVCSEMFLFFTQQLGIDTSHIKLRISSSDEDLFSTCCAIFPQTAFEVDTQQSAYYTHSIGEDGICGRSFNIALRDLNKETFSDIGNIIVLETKSCPIGIEVALGASTILKQIYNLEHVNDCFPFVTIPHPDGSLKRKFEDAAISSIVLWREGLRPIATGGRGRVLRSYLRALLYLSVKLEIKEEDLNDTLRFFEENEFSNLQNYASGDVINYVLDYKEQLLKGIVASKEDELIVKVLT